MDQGDKRWRTIRRPDETTRYRSLNLFIVRCQSLVGIWKVLWNSAAQHLCSFVTNIYVSNLLKSLTITLVTRFQDPPSRLFQPSTSTAFMQWAWQIRGQSSLASSIIYWPHDVLASIHHPPLWLVSRYHLVFQSATTYLWLYCVYPVSLTNTRSLHPLSPHSRSYCPPMFSFSCLYPSLSPIFYNCSN